MNQFEFKSGLILDFGEVQYEITPDSIDFMETFESACKNMQKSAQELQTSKNNNAKGIRKACESLVDTIDMVLGDGATLEIFGERPLAFFDLLDVFNYIQKSVRDFNSARKATVTDISPEPANRAQRRSNNSVAKKKATATKASNE